MAFIKNKHLTLYKKGTLQVIKDLGKPITVFLKEKQQRCGNCIYDDVHKCSSNVYNSSGPKPFSGLVCPVCNGLGIITTRSTRTINAICRWVSFSSKEDWMEKDKTGLENVSYLMVKTDVSFYSYFRDSDYFIYNSERYKLKNLIERGMKESVVCVAYLEKENV